MDTKKMPHQPSLEEEVDRVLRAGEQAKQAAEHEIDQQGDALSEAANSTKHEIQDLADAGGDHTRVAVERVKDEMQQIGDNVADTLDTAKDATKAGVRQARKGTYDVAETLADSAEKASDKAAALVDLAKDHTKDAVSDLRSSNVGEVADSVKHKASEVGQQVVASTDAALNATGERIENFAGSVRDNAPSGATGDVVTKAADALEHSGQYLKRTSTSTLVGDLTDLVRRRPIPALLVALGVGYIAMRALRNNDRY